MFSITFILNVCFIRPRKTKFLAHGIKQTDQIYWLTQSNSYTVISKLHGYNSPNRQRTLLSKCLILKLKILLNTCILYCFVFNGRPFGLVNVLLKFCHFFFQLEKNNKCIVNTEPQLYSIKYISSNLESIYVCNVQGRVYNLTQNVHYIKQVINRI